FDQETLDQLSPNRLSTSPGLTGLRNLGQQLLCKLRAAMSQQYRIIGNALSSSASGTTCQRGFRCIVEIRRLRCRLGRRRQQKGTPAETSPRASRSSAGLWCGAFASVSPAGILTAVGRYAAGSTFEGGQEQQDAQEFLLFLCSTACTKIFNRRSTGKAFESSSASL
uniref:Secreted protein n=1 Tax=Macrostomum lignano TaxID=282301 RepID=A0A1I8F6I4_9PLAT